MRTCTLVYSSKAKIQFTDDSIRSLTEKSSCNNALSGITGLLLYGSGNFLQVLEGNNSSIHILFERIRRDPRHDDCELLFEHTRDRRLFPKWNMGLLNLDGPGYTDGGTWDHIRSTLSGAGAVNGEQTDPVIGWIRQFMAHNGGGGGLAISAA